VPLVAIFAGSQPDLTGPVGGGPLAILGAQGAPPTLAAVADAVEAIVPRGEGNADEQA
jgi:heptosyltransferase-1